MDSTSLTSSMFISNLLTERPTFVKHPGDKYICTYCKDILLPPVKQTQCGHRFCGEPCVEELFSRGVLVECPGRAMEEDDDCDMLEKDQLHPDMATQRELLMCLVYCCNRDRGCTEVMKWALIHKHLETCPYMEVTCSNTGCDVMVLVCELDQHQSVCEFRLVQCDMCNMDRPKKEFDNGHVKNCSKTPRECPLAQLGACGYTGVPKKLTEHLQTKNPHHLTEMAAQMSSVISNQSKLLAQTSKLEERIQSLTESSNTQNTGANCQDSNEIALLQNELKQLKVQISQCVSNTELKVVKDLVRRVGDHDEKLAVLETVTTAEPQTEHLQKKVSELESSNACHSAKIAEYDIRFRLNETATYRGRLIWKITNFGKRRKDAIEARVVSIYSQPFYSSEYGYKMSARAYLNGDGLGKGTHLSLFFVVMRGEYDALLKWPFRHKVTLTVLDPSGNGRHISDTFRPDPTSTSFKRPTNEMNIASGSPLFAKLSDVTKDYIREDTLYVSACVDLTDIKEPWEN